MYHQMFLCEIWHKKSGETIPSLAQANFLLWSKAGLMNLAWKTNDISMKKKSHTAKLIFYKADPAIDRILLRLSLCLKLMVLVDFWLFQFYFYFSIFTELVKRCWIMLFSSKQTSKSQRFKMSFHFRFIKWVRYSALSGPHSGIEIEGAFTIRNMAGRQGNGSNDAPLCKDF